MGKPMILWGLAPLSNPSFESDADLVAATGWTAGGVNPDQNVVASMAQSPGHGIPSVRGYRQNVTSGTAGNKALLTQRFQLPAVLEILKADGGELAAAASLNAADGVGLSNASILIEQYSGGSSTIGSGSLEAAPASRAWRTAGPDWFLQVAAVEIHADTEWIELSLVYDIATAGYGVSSHAYWDRVLCGGLCDLTRNPRRWRPELQRGDAINRGDAVVEVVRTRKPNTRIDIEWRNMFEGQPDELALRRFNRWSESEAGTIAIWGDRDELTNAGRHYDLAVVDPRFRLDYPIGALRRNYRWRIEAIGQGVS